jgi:hypothetical protein
MMEQIWSTSIGKQNGVDLLNAHAQWHYGVEPVNTYPFQNWADTANNLWKQRNEVNDDWIIRGVLNAVNFGLATTTDINNLIPNINLGRVHVPVRQTVLYGLVDAGGQAAFLTTISGLSINILATSTPLIITFAYNFDNDFGQVDYVGKIIEDIPSAWANLTANQSAIYLYIDRNLSSGQLTYGFSLLQPNYAIIAPSTPSTDQHWFDLNAFYMKRWNGSAWEIKQRVFVGECVTGASSVTSVITYGLRGQYDSGEFNITINTLYTKTPNLGLPPGDVEIDGYIQSSGQYRKINNIGRASDAGNTGQQGGDVVWQEDNVIKLKTNVNRIHPSYGLAADTQYPNNATSGTARLFAKRRF